ncbi:probable pectinesterase/pectinesterase inhibitor 12 [Gastrolobium bilobum]|uniref:probable pectinesterase/pectinesterase inhibitor 12 n=1 Tax=Gastrolobium bilobum TaxID=150636 RepID=UPI002AB0B50D|nr:probable pectinesterase/pectinesterase inhibitor 12 [Gastrolobium bilobum]
MATSSPKLFLLLLTILFSHTWVVNSSESDTYVYSQNSSCVTTRDSEVCYNNSTSIHVSHEGTNININSNGSSNSNSNSNLLQSLQVAISETKKLSDQFINAGYPNIIENKIGAVQDCRELHQSTLASLIRSQSRISSPNSKNLIDARTYLSAALTNKNTCLESLHYASGTLKQVLVNSVINTYKHVGNSLSMVPKPEIRVPKHNRRLMGVPTWLSSKDRRFLQSTEHDPKEVLVVAADGTGNFSTITEAIRFVPNNSFYRTMIYVKEGIYEENVEIPSYKTNISLFGDGSDATVITGSRSMDGGWTTFKSATLAVSGEGFLGRDIGFENKAGAEKHQAVALRVNADKTAFYRCAMHGYQDTLYVHSFRQFYRECDVYGTIDFIFGNAAVVLQACKIESRMPLPGQITVITAQSRDTPDEDTGISIQNCSILANKDLDSNIGSFKSYLGRPWKPYSRTVYLESYIDDFIDPMGWTKWSLDQVLFDKLYFGEYKNYGPGAGIQNRIEWLGFHSMNYDSAYDFTVSEFIARSGDDWLRSISLPYDDGI